MDVTDPQLFTGTVEVDEAYVGGKHKSRPASTRVKGYKAELIEAT